MPATRHARRSTPSLSRLPTWAPTTWSRVLRAGVADPDALPPFGLLECNGAAKASFDTLIRTGMMVERMDRGHSALPLLLDGTTMTHELSEVELALDVLLVDPDLSLLLEPLHARLQLVGGGTLRVRDPETGWAGGVPSGQLAVEGPSGWLDGLQPGDRVALRLARGRFTLIPGVELQPAERAHAAALRAAVEHALALAALPDDKAAVPVREALWMAMERDRLDLRKLRPPLGAQLRDLGYAVGHGWVGRAGVDLSRHRHIPAPALDLGLQARWHGTSGDTSIEALCCATVRARLGLLDMAPAALRTLAVQLGEWPQAMSLRLVVGGDPGLPQLMRVLLPYTDSAGAVVAHTVLAYDAEGDPRRAQQHLDAALALDPEDACAQLEAAGWAEDRGDVELALTLLRDVPLSDGDGTVVRLALRAAAPRTSRADRVPFLWLRAGAWAVATHRLPVLLPLMQAVVPDGFPAEAAIDAPDEAWFQESLLLDWGQLAAYLAQRGAALPVEDREVLQAAIGSPWRVGRVTQIRRRAIWLEDVLTGEVEELARRESSAIAVHLAVGMVLLHHALPDGEGGRYVGLGARLVEPGIVQDVARLVARGGDGVELAQRMPIFRWHGPGRHPGPAHPPGRKRRT